MVEIAIGKSKWKHLVDPSERRDDLLHQTHFDKMCRRLVDDTGMTWKQSREFMSKSIALPEAERFDDVNAIIKEEGDY